MGSTASFKRAEPGRTHLESLRRSTGRLLSQQLPPRPVSRSVVAGDLVYGDCYQYLAEANTREKRANWIKAVEHIESLRPKIVIPGHKRRSQVDGAYLTTTTKEYIRIFEKELENMSSGEELEKRMIELYPERWNQFILERSCASSFAAREKEQESV